MTKKIVSKTEAINMIKETAEEKSIHKMRKME
jgi:hypothetical protein